MGVDSLIMFLPLITGIIIAVTMKSIKIGVGTASFAGAITLFVTSNMRGGDWSYFVGAILCVCISGLCFYDAYRIDRRKHDFKTRLGKYINSGLKIQRDKSYSNQKLESKINEWTKAVAPDLLINKGKYIEGLFIDEFWVKGQYKYIEDYKQMKNGDRDIQNTLRNIISHRIDLLKELIEGIVYDE